jgi:hypothetical protein
LQSSLAICKKRLRKIRISSKSLKSTKNLRI